MANFQVDSRLSDLTYDHKDSPLKAVRISAFNQNTVRIVCDLKKASAPAVSLSKGRKNLNPLIQKAEYLFRTHGGWKIGGDARPRPW